MTSRRHTVKITHLPILIGLALVSVFTPRARAQDVLPRPGAAFQGAHRPHGRRTPPRIFPQEVKAPKGAPNILLILTDDVGFGASSTFGGPVPTPTLDRLAQRGSALHAVSHHGAVLADARGAPDRTQSPLRGDRHHHGRRHRLSRLQHADAEKRAAPSPRCSSRTATTPRGTARITTSPTGTTARPGRSISGRPDWALNISMASSAATPASGRRPSSRTSSRSSRRTTTRIISSTRTWPTRHRPDPHAALGRAGQAVADLLRPGHGARPAPCAEGLDRQIQGPVRSGLGQGARGNARAAEGAGHRSAGHEVDRALSRHSARGTRSTPTTRRSTPT